MYKVSLLIPKFEILFLDLAGAYLIFKPSLDSKDMTTNDL